MFASGRGAGYRKLVRYRRYPTYRRYLPYLDVELEAGRCGGPMVALVAGVLDQLVDGLLVDVESTWRGGLKTNKKFVNGYRYWYGSYRCHICTGILCVKYLSIPVRCQIVRYRR